MPLLQGHELEPNCSPFSAVHLALSISISLSASSTGSSSARRPASFLFHFHFILSPSSSYRSFCLSAVTFVLLPSSSPTSLSLSHPPAAPSSLHFCPSFFLHHLSAPRRHIFNHQHPLSITNTRSQSSTPALNHHHTTSLPSITPLQVLSRHLRLPSLSSHVFPATFRYFPATFLSVPTLTSASCSTFPILDALELLGLPRRLRYRLCLRSRRLRTQSVIAANYRRCSRVTTPTPSNRPCWLVAASAPAISTQFQPLGIATIIHGKALGLGQGPLCIRIR